MEPLDPFGSIWGHVEPFGAIWRHPILDTRIFVRACITLRPPPWILKWGGLESSGQRLIASIGKTKRIAFFSAKKNKLKKHGKEAFVEIFPDFLSFFYHF